MVSAHARVQVSGFVCIRTRGGVGLRVSGRLCAHMHGDEEAGLFGLRGGIGPVDIEPAPPVWRGGRGAGRDSRREVTRGHARAREVTRGHARSAGWRRRVRRVLGSGVVGWAERGAGAACRPGDSQKPQARAPAHLGAGVAGGMRGAAGGMRGAAGGAHTAAGGAAGGGRVAHMKSASAASSSALSARCAV